VKLQDIFIVPWSKEPNLDYISVKKFYSSGAINTAQMSEILQQNHRRSNIEECLCSRIL